MPLVPGTKLGPYEILAPLGAGGMGEVYRGRDTKLHRAVAVKVLPASVARDPERLARFEREAKVLASLNHPNIAQIYGVQEADGYQALVMELVPGETLAARIKAGAIPLDESLRLAGQMVEALSAAHEKGITHRDFKPANVMITPEGVVKVLDFGNAAVAQPSEAPSGSHVPTLTLSPTSAGMIMGTAPYMSPEQARGNQADRRSDIFSFAIVLYEMLTGKQLFHGETVSDVLASVLKDNPNLDEVPEQVRPLLQRCLQKDPKKRLQSIGDWDLLLSNPSTNHDSLPSRDSHAAGAGFRYAGWIAATVATLAAVVLGIGYHRATEPAPLKPLVRLDVDLGSDVVLPPGQLNYGANVVLSPDGSRIAYISNKQLYVRKVDQEKGVALPGTAGATNPFFSPDGKWIGFFTTNKLKKINVDGGAPVDLSDSTNPRGAAWGENGTIVAALSSFSGIWQIPENGGTPVALTRLDEGEASQRGPQMLPGGHAVLYTAYTGNAELGQRNIVATTLADHKRKVILQQGNSARYVPTYGSSGHLLYAIGSTIYAVPFDPQTLETLGRPVQVLDGVASWLGGSADFSVVEGVHGSGTLVYRSGGFSTQNLSTIQWLDSSGKAQMIRAKPDGYMYPSLAPGGDRVAFSLTDVWIYDPRRDTESRVTFDGAQYPLWTPDGQYLVFRKAGQGLFWTRADGGGTPQLLLASKDQLSPTAFSRDGKTLIYGESPRDAGGYDLWTAPIEVGASGVKAGPPKVYLRTKFTERNAAFSPDGHWVAYTSDESGIFQIYVRAFPDNGSKWQISSEGGVYPRFSPTGHDLFYRAEDSSKIFAASYAEKNGSFVAEKPRVWSDKQLIDARLSSINYDVAADGKRIIALMPVDTPEAQRSQSHVVFLENFFDELKRKVPLK